MGSAFQKAAPLTGITFAILYLLGVGLQHHGAPAFGASGEDAVAFFKTNYSNVITGAFLVFVSTPFWFIFNGVLFAAIRDKEEGAGRLGVTLASSGAAAAAVTIAGQGLAVAAATRAHAGTLNPVIAPIYYDAFIGLVFTCTAITAAAYVFALAAGSLRHGAVLPKPLGALMLILAVLFLVPVPAVSSAVVAIGVLVVLYASFSLYRENAGEL